MVTRREAWAHEVRQLLGTEAGGNLAALARMVGIDRRNVTRWLNQTVEVSEESVRQVAHALCLPTGELLVKVGILKPSDLTIQVASPCDDVEASTAVATSGLPPATRRKLHTHLRVTRERHEQQRLAEIQRLPGLIQGLPARTPASDPAGRDGGGHPTPRGAHHPEEGRVNRTTRSDLAMVLLTIAGLALFILCWVGIR